MDRVPFGNNEGLIKQGKLLVPLSDVGARRSGKGWVVGLFPTACGPEDAFLSALQVLVSSLSPSPHTILVTGGCPWLPVHGDPGPPGRDIPLRGDLLEGVRWAHGYLLTRAMGSWKRAAKPSLSPIPPQPFNPWPRLLHPTAIPSHRHDPDLSPPSYVLPVPITPYTCSTSSLPHFHVSMFSPLHCHVLHAPTI